MPSQLEDANRPTRQRSNTTFTPFTWRRGRTDTVVTPAPEPSTPLSLDALIEALTPPAVPSIHHARALAGVLLTNDTSPPRLAMISPVLAGLCSTDSPVSLQAAGYDILAAYWENSGSAVLTTADRLTCFSLFMDLGSPWTAELWEARFKALVALIHSGAETVGIESSLLKVLRAWIEGAFTSLAKNGLSNEEQAERQRSVDAMITLLSSLVRRAEFVSRIAERDTESILELFGNLIDWSLASGWEDMAVPSTPLPDIASSSSTPAARPTPQHHRHQSSVSIPQTTHVPSAADLAVDAYLNYLNIRAKAIAPIHLKTILLHLFRALSYYASPLPHLSLTLGTEHQNEIEKRIMEFLDSLVTGPYSASCTMILKWHLFPDEDDVTNSAATSLGALRTLRASIRRVLMSRLAKAYISQTSSLNYTPSGAPGSLAIDREVLEHAWARDDTTSWDLNRFRRVLCEAIEKWLAVARDADPTLRFSSELILSEVAGILKDITQALDEVDEELDYEQIEAVGEVLRVLVTYIKSQRYVLYAAVICFHSHELVDTRTIPRFGLLCPKQTFPQVFSQCCQHYSPKSCSALRYTQSFPLLFSLSLNT